MLPGCARSLDAHAALMCMQPWCARCPDVHAARMRTQPGHVRCPDAHAAWTRACAPTRLLSARCLAASMPVLSSTP
eukprot:207171-Chlamydomonas_euryale.AAC.1